MRYVRNWSRNGSEEVFSSSSDCVSLWQTSKFRNEFLLKWKMNRCLDPNRSGKLGKKDGSWLSNFPQKSERIRFPICTENGSFDLDLGMIDIGQNQVYLGGECSFAYRSRLSPSGLVLHSWCSVILNVDVAALLKDWAEQSVSVRANGFD